MNRVIAVGLILSLCAPAAHAQQAIVGKYSGAAALGRPSPSTGITIEITSAENGKLKGTFTGYGRGGCAGIFPIDGTYQGNKLEFTAAGGGRTGDCLERKFELVSEGDRLVGRMLDPSGNWREVQLSK